MQQPLLNSRAGQTVNAMVASTPQMTCANTAYCAAIGGNRISQIGTGLAHPYTVTLNTANEKLVAVTLITTLIVPVSANLALLQASAATVNLVEYLKQPPNAADFDKYSML